MWVAQKRSARLSAHALGLSYFSQIWACRAGPIAADLVSESKVNDSGGRGWNKAGPKDCHYKLIGGGGRKQFW